MRYMAERAGSTTVEVDASHAVTVSKQDAVADLIHKAARLSLLAAARRLLYVVVGGHFVV
jgi:hypothetical protein